MTIGKHIAEHAALGIKPYPATQNIEAAEDIPALAVVRYDINNKLRIAKTDTSDNCARIAGLSVKGGSTGFKCSFYGSGVQVDLPAAALVAGADYFLQLDGTIGILPVNAGAVARVLVGTALTANRLSLNIDVYKI